MANVLFVYGYVEPSNIMLRDFFDNITDLDKHGVSVRFISSFDILTTDVEWSDVVIAIRPQIQYVSSIVKLAKKKGKFTGVYIDDDLFSIDGLYMQSIFGTHEIKFALRYADVTISPNIYLAKSILKYTKSKRPVVLHTAISKREIKPHNTFKTNSIRVVYYSNSVDTSNFNEYILPIMDELYQLFGNSIEWFFFNIHPDMSNTRFTNITYYERMELNEFREKLHNGDYDIGIMPLIDNKFNNGKYVNHYFEYSRAGIPGVYSNIYPYSDFVIDKIDGVLCDNTHRGWIDSLNYLFNINNRNRVSINAQNRLRNEFSCDIIFKQLLLDFPELSAYNSKRIRIRNFRCVDFEQWFNDHIRKNIIWVIEVIRISKYMRIIKKIF